MEKEAFGGLGVTIHIHKLGGCAPAPLAHYLKAIGLLRLVSEQADPYARGWWKGESFHLASKLDAEGLETFLMNAYQPSPILSPWNKGSGFFVANDPGLQQMESAKAKRFENFRRSILENKPQLDELQKADRAVRAIKEESKGKNLSLAERNRIKSSAGYQERLREADRRFKREKANLLPFLRKRLRGTIREWIDAAMVLDAEGNPKWPALLGTGGSDGRFDFTNNAMKRLSELYDLESEEGHPKPETAQWVRGSLWGVSVPGSLAGKPAGQYLPGTAGGANNSNGPDSDSLLNPLDFVLLLEGTIAFTSHTTRKMGATDSSRAASPFAVSSSAAAYASASPSDEGARGEQWMPLWVNPITYRELRQLLAEGRAQIGTKPAREPLDLARAVARLGTSRGISSFQRYGYIERNGQSNLAVPLGRFEVTDQKSEQVTCLDDLDAWLGSLRRETHSQNASGRLIQSERDLLNALFQVTGNPELPNLWQSVLLSLGQTEDVMRSGSGFSAGPIPKLRPEWVSACDDGSTEFRLALSFALQAARFEKSGRPTDPIRRHWLPLDRWQSRFATSGAASSDQLESKAEVVIRGRRGTDDAIALIERRLVEASQNSSRHLPLRSAPRASAQVFGLSKLIAGEVDLDRTLSLAKPLMALNHADWAKQYIPMHQQSDKHWPDDAWIAIRLCTLPWPLRTGASELNMGTDPAIIRRLASGNCASALELALSRLRASGVRCTIRGGNVPPITARIWAAALAFPINQTTATQFLYRLDPTKE